MKKAFVSWEGKDSPAHPGGGSVMNHILEACRCSLLRRIGRRMGARLCARIDAEDILQDSLTIAMRIFGTSRTRSAEDFLRLSEAIAKRRMQHEARQGRLRAALPLEEVGAQSGELAAPGRAPQARPQLCEVASRRSDVSADQQWALLLRTWLGVPLGSATVVLNRETFSGAERLHERARGAMRQAQPLL